MVPKPTVGCEVMENTVKGAYTVSADLPGERSSAFLLHKKLFIAIPFRQCIELFTVC